MQHTPDPRLDAQFYDGVPVKRLVAWGIDIVIVLAICLGFVVASLGILAFAFPFVAFLANLGYRIFTIQKYSATLGMRLTGIELRNSQGERLSLSEAAWHTGLYVLLFVSVLGIIANLLSILISERGQGIHDLLLGTIAINRPAD